MFCNTFMMPYNHCCCGNNVFTQVMQFGMMQNMMNMFFAPPRQQVIIQPVIQAPIFQMPQINVPAIPAYNPSIFLNNNQSLVQPINYANLFNNNTGGQGYATSSYNINPFASTTNISATTSVSSTSSVSSSSSESYSYDQATVNKLVEKYNGALKHVGDKQAFVKKVVEIASRHNVDPNAMLVIFYSEGGINPKAAGGLFGLMPKIAPSYGTSIEAFRNMSALQQLDIYEKVLSDQLQQAYGTTKPSTKVSASVLYAMNLCPAYVKGALQDVQNGGKGILMAANSSDPQKRKFFNANSGKGTVADGKDYISFDTIQSRLNRKEREASSLA